MFRNEKKTNTPEDISYSPFSMVCTITLKKNVNSMSDFC